MNSNVCQKRYSPPQSPAKILSDSPLKLMTLPQKKKEIDVLKNVSPLDFQQFNHFKYQKMCLCARMLALKWKGGAFMEKVNSRCFCWFPAAILVDSNCPPIWGLHTKLYKGAWNVSANNSETVGHKDLRFGQIVYILVFYNISFFWFLPLDGFWNLFFCALLIAWQWKRRIGCIYKCKICNKFTLQL